MNRPMGSLYSSSLSSKLATASDLVKSYGWRKFLGKIVPWLFSRRYFFCANVVRALREEPQPQTPLRLEMATEKDFPALMTLRPHHYELRVLKQRLAEGHICFLGWWDRRPVHIRWIFVKSLYLHYIHRTLLLAPGQVYFDEAYTAPEFRGRRIFNTAGSFVRLRLRDLGYKDEICLFASWQAHSRTIAERIQREKVGELKIVNWPGFRKLYCKGSVQDHGDGTISIDRS